MFVRIQRQAKVNRAALAEEDKPSGDLTKAELVKDVDKEQIMHWLESMPEEEVKVDPAKAAEVKAKQEAAADTKARELAAR